jgi:alpha-glutamyl/putrescinyl thymine pyrophosphorylase clade 1
MNETVLKDLAYWIHEREEMREAKEFGKPKPWTQDPILQSYKFCNVHREDDRVTRWFALNWRGPKYWEEPNFIASMIFGRTINWPSTLERLGFPHTWDPTFVIHVLDAISAKGEKVWTGAYMITAGPPGVRKSVWVVGNAETYFKEPPKLDPYSLQRSWETIMVNHYPCVGPFIAGQVIADLKQTPYLSAAEDWWDWAPVGPGSMRGLNRVYGRHLGTKIAQKVALAEMKAIKKELNLNLCLQDVQNCLCELDKYERVKLGQGKPRAGYNGR